MIEMAGGCQCGRIRYSALIDSDDAYLCHCRMCQKATGGVSVAFKSVRKSDVVWHSPPEQYASSSIAKRPFCKECGTPLGFAYNESEYLDLPIGSFDDPSRFRPVENFGAESKHRAWEDTSSLTDQRADEYKPLAERWKEAGETPLA